MPIDCTERPAPRPPAPEGAAGPARSKVTLSEGAPAVSPTKRGSATGPLRIGLTWNVRSAPTGSLTRSAGPTVDLDLGCLYQVTDGPRGVVQALGGAFTTFQTSGTSPAITLDGDDRSGTVSGGDDLSVDLSQLSRIRRVLVFASIDEGVPHAAGADGVVTLHPADGVPSRSPSTSTTPARGCARSRSGPPRGRLRQGQPAGARPGLRVGHELAHGPHVSHE